MTKVGTVLVKITDADGLPIGITIVVEEDVWKKITVKGQSIGPARLEALTKPTSQGLCETTKTERFAFAGCKCDMSRYPDNLGPCKTFEEGANLGRCVYCDHTPECHKALLEATSRDEVEAVDADWVRKARTLLKAVEDWAGDCEGHPASIADARLMKALWTFGGDRTTACPECDGDCGEPCAPSTVAAAHAGLDAWIERESARLRALPPDHWY